MNPRNGLFKFSLGEKVFFINSTGTCVHNKGRLVINAYFWYRTVLAGIPSDLEIFTFLKQKSYMYFLLEERQLKSVYNHFHIHPSTCNFMIKYHDQQNQIWHYSNLWYNI